MNSMQVKTAKIQSMLNKAIKCAGNNKTNVLTNLVYIELKDNVLSMTTTDVNNYFTVIEKDVSGDDLSFAVQVDTFSKLISKTSVEDIRINVADDYIQVVGNGTYKLPIQLDVDGSPIKYPNPTINNADESGEIKISSIKNVILHNKNSLALTDEEPCLRGYYFVDGSVVSADSFNICKNNLSFFNTNLLIDPKVCELLSICSDEEVSYKISDNNALFESDSIKLFSHLMNDKEKYDQLMETIDSVVDFELSSNCVLPKTSLLNVIDRLSLFIKDNDQNGVYMTFTKNGVKVENIDNSGIEDIPYQSSNNFTDYSCCVGVDSLKRQLQSIVGESVNIYYGNDQIMTIKQDNAIHIISLLEDNRQSE